MQLLWMFMPSVTHFAAFCLAFSSKTHCIQRHFTLRLAPKHTPFSTKTHSILQQIAPKQVQVAVLSNKYSFCQHLHATPFCTQTNLHENRLFAARWTNGWKKGTHNVKFLAENQTRQRLCHVQTHGSRYSKLERLRPPARVVAGLVAHGQ